MRTLPAALEQALSSGTRRPAYKVLVWTQSDYTAVITGSYTETPFDLTPYVTGIRWTPEQLVLDLTDPAGDLHPDYGAYRDRLAPGVIVRLLEGDRRVSETAWVVTFTGKVKGQYGYSYSRAERAWRGQVQVFWRGAEQAWRRRKITTREYTVGTDLGIAVSDILDLLGVTAPERRIPDVLGRVFYHKTNQLAQVTPWEALETLLLPPYLVPCFDGEGRFAAYSKQVARVPDLVWPDYSRIYRVEAAAQAGDPVNKVVVKYLDSNLTEIEGEYQVLGRASITTGFFTMKEELDCYWSEDRKQRAKNTSLKVIKSINDNLLPVGSEEYQEIDEYHGRITITINAWVPTLAGASLAAYLALAAQPDKTESVATNKAPVVLSAPGEVNLVAPTGGGPVTGTVTIPSGGIVTTEDTGFTIPWGRIAEATALAGILLIMMSLGSAQYEIWGVPYDLVYLEREQIAVEDGVNYWEENEVKLENDFIGTQEAAEAIAISELHYQRSAFQARRIICDDLPGLEIGDIIRLPEEGNYFVTGLSKQIRPGEVPKLEITCFKILEYEVTGEL